MTRASTLFYKVPQALAARRDVLATAKIVYAVVVDSIGDNDHSWIGTWKLARKAGLSRPTVMAAVNQLAADGLLLVEKRGNGKVNWYRLPDTGQESLPVKEPDRSKGLTTGGQEAFPEAVKNLYPNQTDPLNQTPRDVFAESFKAAFDATFSEPYAWSKADFVQLAKWKRAYSGVTPERFAEVAQGCWRLGKYRPGACMTIKGLCAGWAQMAAKADGGRETAAGDDALSRHNWIPAEGE